MTNQDERPAAEDGNFVADRLAEHYRLTQAEFEKARAALEPAFALGMRQALESPARWAELSKAFMAMTPRPDASARAAGETFLGAIFGAPGLRDAVSRQAAALTGIAPDILSRMMPQMATIGMEAMMRGALAEWSRLQPAGLASGDLGAATAEMMRRGANAVEALTRPSDEGRPSRGATLPMPANFFADAFAQAMRSGFDFWGQAAGVAKPVAPPPASFAARGGPAADPVTPFAMMFDAFAKGMRAAADATRLPLPQPAPGAASRPPRPEDDLVGNFLQTGRRMQEDYAREMAALFDRFSDKGAANG
ncbi:hypothetical protein GCM10011390_15310 [Aureimonas endophytica]|uniref:DUF937 domain-containing protein n=1 Tax=Aureimonas endophytica TaxID=2027858 RepID=A0A917E261_9HYPH|nr:hypothetical protein [Aureimonas endophytica]GGD97429.1 hypothetical protein GCM10011390_15310 [Aureimonas endophytica]